MNELVIGNLDPKRIPETARVIAAAMSSNPIHVAVFQGKGKDEVRRQEAMFEVILQHAPGQARVARRDRRIVGAYRMVKWPGCQPSREASEKLLPLLEQALGDSIPRVVHWVTIWKSFDPMKTHWHLGPVAVDPEVQGQGIGTKLMEDFCSHVDRQGDPAYLETDKPGNVRLYERFGFSVKNEEEIYGVKNFFMWRSRH